MFYRSLLLCLLCIGTAQPETRAATVQLELIGDAQGSALAFQQWGEALGRAGIVNFRIQSDSGADRVGIETQGEPDHPVYVVTGLIRSADDLVLPGAKFRRNEVGRLKQWLDDLAQNGPPGVDGSRKQILGLSPAQFGRIHQELSTPVAFATSGQNARQLAEQIAGSLNRPLKMDDQTALELGQATVSEELTGLTRGAALAYVLQSAGFGFVPQPSGDYTVVKLRRGAEVWPVGWPPEKSDQRGPSALFEFRNVNVQNVSAATALDAIAKRTRLPILLDRPNLSRHGIDPDKAMVSLPRSRTTYSLALRRLLFKAGMKFEVRYDEAGSPLLWVTSVKP
ncbi:MAG: hypothetical protein ABFC77_01595 [Thermoguttaceae bacterium]